MRPAAIATLAIAVAACGSGRIAKIDDARATPTATASATPAAPAWCTAAREELATSDKLVDRTLVAGTDTATLEALAKKLAHERAKLDALSAGAGSATSALGYAASAANEVSALVYLLLSRKTGNLPEEAPAIERALYVAVRHRRRADYVARAYCDKPHYGEPNAAFAAGAESGFPFVPAQVEPCHEVARAAATEVPITVTMLVQIDPTGHPWLVAPALLDIEPGNYALTDAIECVTRRLEEITFPAPGAQVTVSIPIEIGARK